MLNQHVLQARLPRMRDVRHNRAQWGGAVSVLALPPMAPGAGTGEPGERTIHSLHLLINVGSIVKLMFGDSLQKQQRTFSNRVLGCRFENTNLKHVSALPCAHCSRASLAPR